MELTDTNLNYFVNNRLRLQSGRRTEYLAQVDRLIDKRRATRSSISRNFSKPARCAKERCSARRGTSESMQTWQFS